MISYNLITLLVIIILFALLYKLNVNNIQRESFEDNTECRDVNQDYCSAFNSSSPECNRK